MRNSRASLAEVARSTGFADQHLLARVFQSTTGIASSSYVGRCNNQLGEIADLARFVTALF